ncbi:MROH7 protein, partial [Odontophorus gujanensis]|nr:MROH7 protein [Odontophorus gujanensis]
MPPTEEVLKKLCNPAVLRRFLKIRRLPILWLVLRGLDLLSRRPEMAREIQVLLPDVTETLQFTNKHTVLMALNILNKMVTHLRKRETSPFAPDLSKKLLPLFNHVSNEVRECSILLFKDLIEAVVWWQKADVKKNVHRGLLPLLFRMSDETPSIAQASGEALIACARFLKWKKLKQQAKRKKKVDIKDCLLKQGRRRVDDYLYQSVLYLRDSQASLRCEAVEFIGLALQHFNNQSEEKVNVICTALEPLQNDAHPSVRSAATGIIQRQQRQQAEPARSRPAALFCWPC